MGEVESLFSGLLLVTVGGEETVGLCSLDEPLSLDPLILAGRCAHTGVTSSIGTIPRIESLHLSQVSTLTPYRCPKSALLPSRFKP